MAAKPSPGRLTQRQGRLGAMNVVDVCLMSFDDRRSLWWPQLGGREWKKKGARWRRQWRIIVGRCGEAL